MIIVRLKGGMGNQLFQYALGRMLSIKNNVDLGIDTSFFDNPGKPVRTYDLDLFVLSAKILKRNELPFWYQRYGSGTISRTLHKIREKIYPSAGVEKFFTFDRGILSLGDDIYLDGYWQSYKYFESIADTIREDFRLKEPLPSHIEKLRQSIQSKQSVCIHVRRGDYVGNAAHDSLDRMTYYREALAHIPNFDAIYVFSDDIDWCKEHMKFDTLTIFVEEEYAGERAIGHFALMQSCKYFVIANSSFSWWAAWLGQYPQKVVVAPKQWFADTTIDTSDLIPPEWIRV